MQYCPKCKIKVRGHKTQCPLCNSPLKGEPENPAFPTIEKRKMTRVSVFKISLFLAISFVVVLNLFMYLFGYHPWMGLAFLLDLLGIVDIWLILVYRQNPIKTYHIQIYVMMLVTFIIDQGTGVHRWNFAWLYPAAFLSLIIVTFILSRIVKFHLEDYIIYYISATLFSLLQLIFVLNGVNPHPEFAMISMTVMVIFAVAVSIFHGRELKNAGNKYLHL